MKLIALALLALSSVAIAATRPHYGGTMRVAAGIAPSSLDPIALSQSDSMMGDNLSSLLFDTLVRMSDRGSVEPALSTSWQPEPGNQRWRFSLCKNVSFSDGTALTSDAVAASLRASNSAWKVFPAGDAVVIESDVPVPDLPAQLTLGRYAIAKRTANRVLGTGPYVVSQWDPGKRLALAARDDYRQGRPFVDTLEIDLGKNLRDQMIALDVGKADLVEVAPEQARHAGMENRRVDTSSPAVLIALIFARDAASPEETRLRQALSAGIDRGALSNVFFQGGAEPAGSILPNWMTGYGFLFPASPDTSRVRQIRGDVRQATTWILGYNIADPMSRVMAERIALNARDIGIMMQPSASGAPDVRLARIALPSLDQQLSLALVARVSGLPQPNAAGGSVEDMYSNESALLNTQRMIPLLHARTAVGLAPSVKDWSENKIGLWQLPDVWLGAARP